MGLRRIGSIGSLVQASLFALIWRHKVEATVKERVDSVELCQRCFFSWFVLHVSFFF